jgi:hypothetical protein
MFCLPIASVIVYCSADRVRVGARAKGGRVVMRSVMRPSASRTVKNEDYSGVQDGVVQFLQCTAVQHLVLYNSL